MNMDIKVEYMINYKSQKQFFDLHTISKNCNAIITPPNHLIHLMHHPSALSLISINLL